MGSQLSLRNGGIFISWGGVRRWSFMMGLCANFGLCYTKLCFWALWRLDVWLLMRGLLDLLEVGDLKGCRRGL